MIYLDGTKIPYLPQAGHFGAKIPRLEASLQVFHRPFNPLFPKIRELPLESGYDSYIISY